MTLIGRRLAKGHAPRGLRQQGNLRRNFNYCPNGAIEGVPIDVKTALERCEESPRHLS